jgi:hypothetical protein
MPPPTTRDPAGHYARLGLSHTAGPVEIAAAWRRKARVLHPDVPETGNAAAFIAMKQAYDVLSDSRRRREYDRNAQSVALDAVEPGEILPDPVPPLPGLGFELGWFGMPNPMWLGLAAVLLFAVAQTVWHLAAIQDSHPAGAPMGATPAPMVVTVGGIAPRQDITPDQPPRQAAHTAPSGAPDPGAPGRLPGTPNAYIIPAAGPALLFRHDAEKKVLISFGQLPPFTPVQALRLFRQVGMVEIKVTETATAYVEAARLAGGDAAAAHRAYCGYNAGPPPDNGEVLEQRGAGNRRLAVESHVNQPVVLKLRNVSGAVVASVYLAPNGHADIGGLPDDDVQPDYAIGELWSRACGGFAAGMRAQRLHGFVPLAKLSPLIVPPGPDAAAPADIAEQTFERGQ